MEKNKTMFMQILRYLLSFLMVFGGLQHFMNPDFYVPFMPEFLPNPKFFILASGVVEIIFALMLVLKVNIAKFGAYGLLIMTAIFIPIHIRDVIIENPAIGSHDAALVRLSFQFVLLAWTYSVYSFLKKESENGK